MRGRERKRYRKKGERWVKEKRGREKDKGIKIGTGGEGEREVRGRQKKG